MNSKDLRNSCDSDKEQKKVGVPPQKEGELASCLFILFRSLIDRVMACLSPLYYYTRAPETQIG